MDFDFVLLLFGVVLDCGQPLAEIISILLAVNWRPLLRSCSCAFLPASGRSDCGKLLVCAVLVVSPVVSPVEPLVDPLAVAVIESLNWPVNRTW